MDNLRSFPFVWVFVDINYPLSIDLGVTHHSSVDKESVCNAGDPGLIPGWERFPGKGIGYPFQYSWCFLVAQLVKNPSVIQQTWLRPLGWEDPLEKGKATHSCILAWRIPWTVESGGLYSPWGHKKVDKTE